MTIIGYNCITACYRCTTHKKLWAQCRLMWLQRAVLEARENCTDWDENQDQSDETKTKAIRPRPRSQVQDQDCSCSCRSKTNTKTNMGFYRANAFMYAMHSIAVAFLSVCLSVKCVHCDKTKAPREKSSTVTNRKLTTSFPMSWRWTAYVAPKPQRGSSDRLWY